MVYQEENCPDTGRRHVQGYVYYKNGKTVARTRAMIKGADCDVAYGSAAKNKAYCTKIDSRRPGGIAIERETMPDQGARTDIHEAREDIEAGMNDRDMFRKHGNTWARNMQVLIHHRSAMVDPRTEWTKTLVLWGKTGIGKSSRALWTAQQNPGNVATMLLPRSDKDMVWGDGCINANTIIIEDMGCPAEISYTMIKKMLDWPPLLMPVKGMSMQFAPKYVIITSNHNPDMWYAGKDGDWNINDNALCRRLTTNGSRIVHMTRPWKAPEPRVESPIPDAQPTYEDDESDADLDLRVRTILEMEEEDGHVSDQEPEVIWLD